jgi:hypothetical protein
MRDATPGQRDALRRQILAVRHRRHCVSEIDVRFLEHPLGVLYGSPQNFDWSRLASIGQAAGSRLSFTPLEPSLPIVNGRMQRPPPGRGPDHYFEMPDPATAARLAAAARILVRYCRT